MLTQNHPIRPSHRARLPACVLPTDVLLRLLPLYCRRTQVSRRTWDTEEYQRRADERREEEERLEREASARAPAALARTAGLYTPGGMSRFSALPIRLLTPASWWINRSH